MKTALARLLVGMYLLCAIAASAQNTTITGTITGPTTSFNGVLQLQLYVAASVPATVGCGGAQAYFVIPSLVQLTITNGVVQGSGRPVWGADCLNVPQDPYKITIRDQQGNIIVSDYWLIQGSTFDVGTAVSAAPQTWTTGILLRGNVTTTASASDAVSITGLTSAGHCWQQATNSTAAGLTGVYLGTAGIGTVTLFHSSSSGGTFNVFCTPN